jgi:mannose-6-phosphate isomerase-like protein (cupin superfamily)
MFAGDTSAVPTPKVIRLEPKGKSYLKLLGGLPESYGMRSGLVTLKPGESVGEHNTEEYEEIIITLKGEGEMRITGEESLRVNEKVVLYCPPHTEHDVFNVGKKLLQYIYVVSKAPK